MSGHSSDHWAATLIGTPWIAGESDCWSFARRVWRERFGWDVPPLGAIDPASPRTARRAFAAPPGDAGWLRVERPTEGCGVLMAMGRDPCHVGVWIEPDLAGVLHSVERAGVLFTVPAALPLLGYRITGFYARVA